MPRTGRFPISIPYRTPAKFLAQFGLLLGPDPQMGVFLLPVRASRLKTTSDSPFGYACPEPALDRFNIFWSCRMQNVGPLIYDPDRNGARQTFRFPDSSVPRESDTVPLILRLRASSFFNFRYLSGLYFVVPVGAQSCPREVLYALNEYCATCAHFSTAEPPYNESCAPGTGPSFCGVIFPARRS